jgi:hypothetical protein
LPGIDEQNGEKVDAVEVQMGAGGQPTPQLVEALTQLLEMAKKGQLTSLAWVQVMRNNKFGCFQLGHQGENMYAGLGVLRFGFEHGWFTQIQQQVAAMQQAGLQRATAADLQRLPEGFGRRR